MTGTEITGFVIGIIGLILAVIQFFDAREAKADAKTAQEQQTAGAIKITELNVELQKANSTIGDLTHKISSLEKTTSTHAISQFPDNVPRICELLNSCTENMSLKIMVDYIGYSSYSDQDSFEDYRKALQGAISRHVDIKLLAYDFGGAKRALQRQYPSIAEERTKDRFRNFFAHTNQPNAQDEKEFYRALFAEEERLYREIASLKSPKVQIKLLTDEPPALFWLKDNPHAMVISFRDEFPGTGLSFESEDSNLVKQFDIMFGTHWNRAEDHWDQRW